jgi:hypothetical protein
MQEDAVYCGALGFAGRAADYPLEVDPKPCVMRQRLSRRGIETRTAYAVAGGAEDGLAVGGGPSVRLGERRSGVEEEALGESRGDGPGSGLLGRLSDLATGFGDGRWPF